jgi:hypothetical protein
VLLPAAETTPVVAATATVPGERTTGSIQTA